MSKNPDQQLSDLLEKYLSSSSHNPMSWADKVIAVESLFKNLTEDTDINYIMEQITHLNLTKSQEFVLFFGNLTVNLIYNRNLLSKHLQILKNISDSTQMKHIENFNEYFTKSVDSVFEHDVKKYIDGASLQLDIIKTIALFFGESYNIGLNSIQYIHAYFVPSSDHIMSKYSQHVELMRKIRKWLWITVREKVTKEMKNCKHAIEIHQVVKNEGILHCEDSDDETDSDRSDTACSLVNSSDDEAKSDIDTASNASSSQKSSSSSNFGSYDSSFKRNLQKMFGSSSQKSNSSSSDQQSSSDDDKESDLCAKKVTMKQKLKNDQQKNKKASKQASNINRKSEVNSNSNDATNHNLKSVIELPTSSNINDNVKEHIGLSINEKTDRFCLIKKSKVFVYDRVDKKMKGHEDKICFELQPKSNKKAYAEVEEHTKQFRGSSSSHLDVEPQKYYFVNKLSDKNAEEKNTVNDQKLSKSNQSNETQSKFGELNSSAAVKLDTQTVVTSSSSQSKLLNEFDQHLKTLRRQKAKKFNFSLFNKSTEAERKECVNQLLKFAIVNSTNIEKIAKFTQTFMSFTIITSDKIIIKDISKFLTELCEQKMKILESKRTDWREIEHFGIYLAHLYALNLLKARIIYKYLDETVRLADEADSALEIFFCAFKIVCEVMQRKDVRNYFRYLKHLEDFMKNCPQKIPKLYGNWLSEIFKSKKSAQNIKISSLNSEINQNAVENSASFSEHQYTENSIQNESQSNEKSSKFANEAQTNIKSNQHLERIVETLTEMSAKPMNDNLAKMRNSNQIHESKFDILIKNLPNVVDLSSHIAQMKTKIFHNEASLKEFVRSVWNCCVNDTNLIQFAMNFCNNLNETEKLKEILTIFMRMKFITAKNNEKTLKLATNFYKNNFINAKSFEPWLNAEILEKFNYHEILEFSEIISDKNSYESTSHCFQEKGYPYAKSSSEVYGILGKHDLNITDEPDVTKVFFDDIKIHHEWKAMETKYNADIALLKLKDEITFNKYVQPICLPEQNTNVFNERGTVAGYGLSEESGRYAETLPKFIEIESVTQDICLFSHEKIVRISTPRSFCAGEYGKNPCKGDSGSGFYVKIGNSYTIFGIVSSALTAECEENQFVIFTNVPKFITWIRDHLEMNEIRNATLKCEYLYNQDEDRYECYDKSLVSTTSYVRISSNEGEFTDPKLQSYRDVDTIVIKGGTVTYVPDMTHANEKFPNFKQFFIVNSGLKYVERSKLAKMPQLTILNFYGNEIEHLDEDVFDDLVNLKIVAFVNNKIKVLPQKLLWNLRKLEEIWTFDNPIEVIPTGFFKNNKEIEKIWMGNSKIKKIYINFRGFRKLETLDLRDNECINEQVCGSCDHKSVDEIQEKINRDCRA